MVRQEIFFLRKDSKKKMFLAEEKKDVENIITSYETRIQSIGSLFDTTYQILEGFQNPFLDTKQEREKISVQLRENLTKYESLRRKDFDNMMQGILSTQEERERQIREVLNRYLTEQKEMVHTLGDNLAKFKDTLAKGEAQRVKEFQALIKEILAKQDERKNEVTSQLKEFQKQQQELAKRLKELLAKGRELRIKDLKIMLKEFQAQHKGRIARQSERRRDVCSMLDELKKERLEAGKNWQNMQKKMTQKEPAPIKAVNIVNIDAQKCILKKEGEKNGSS